ncbi:hypothetical protein SLE2022_074300 [Rubroshorea leprosula]
MFYIIPIIALLFITYTISLTSHLSTYPADTQNNEIIKAKATPKTISIFGSKPPVATQGKIEPVDMGTIDPLVPPFNITKEERIEWFRRKCPELKLFKANNSRQKFHDQVLEFFNKDCSAHYFMVWLSPAQSFGPREFSTIDSLFKADPNGCLIILSTSLNSRQGHMILKPLLHRGFKVLAVIPDLHFLLKNTPAKAWLDEMNSGTRDPGTIPLSNNLSNLIRLAILYKYGGIYLDVDFIILKDFREFRNAIGAQSMNTVTGKWNRLNGAVMIFDADHPILHDFLEEFATTFDGSKWGHNGPYLISRVTRSVEDMPGRNFTISPPKTFYPIDWIKIVRLFKKPETESELKRVEEMLLEFSTSSYAIHLWNHRTRELIIEEGSVMERLISDHCIVCQQTHDQ